MTALQVTSEIGPLRAVLVHEPGNEVLAVTPGTRKDFLYNDIIELDTARHEHQTMMAVLRRFAEVYEVADLLRDVAADANARERLARQARSHSPAIPGRLDTAAPHELVTMLIEGTEAYGGPIAHKLNEGGYALPPLPNLFFMRDLGMVIGEHAVVGSMRHGSRWSEELLIKALFCHHPTLANAGILYDGSEERRLDVTLEGGDVHPVREDLLIVGVSDRTSALALDHLCDLVFERGRVTDVLVVVMPGEPTAIHLDMIFTQVDRDVCVVSPAQFVGAERLAVLHRRRGEAAVREMPDFFAALRKVDLPMEPVLCGGTDRTQQEREQWASGCNLLAVRPGVCLAYRRNEATLAQLGAAGFQIVDAEAVVDGTFEIAPDDRAVITMRGSELVRGGGGPRCMTMPLRRDAV